MSAFTTKQANSSFRRPNVIVILMDDLAWGDLACHGNPHTRTPNLDRLHDQSAQLTRYCSGPLCTPARAALMTGRHPYRTRAIDTYCGRSMIDPDERTLANVLADADYRTGIFGKWHLGDNYPMRAIDMGFKEALVHNGGGLCQGTTLGHDSYFDPTLYHNGTQVHSKGYCTDVFTDAAMAFIEQNQANPFFVYLATNAPHSPFQIADEWVKPYLDMGLESTFAKVYGMVENIDMNVGRVMKQLEDLHLTDDTIVIYTSDHWPCGSARHDGQIRFNAGLRDIKGTMYEGGLRVPCFWRWPGKIKANTSIDRIANPIDVLPTLAGLCRVDPPADRALDGMNLSGLMTGQTESNAWPDRTICMQWHRGNAPVRYTNYAVIQQQYKLYRHDVDEKEELYDIEADPREQHDLGGEQPHRVNDMRQIYDQWFDDVSATRGASTYDPPRIIIGTPHENPSPLSRQDWRVHGSDGWDDDRFGHWEIQISRRANYQATLHFTPLPQAGQVFLQINDRLEQVDVAAQADHCLITLDNLEQGMGRLEAWVQVDGRRYAAKFIEIGCDI